MRWPCLSTSKLSGASSATAALARLEVVGGRAQRCCHSGMHTHLQATRTAKGRTAG